MPVDSGLFLALWSEFRSNGCGERVGRAGGIVVNEVRCWGMDPLRWLAALLVLPEAGPGSWLDAIVVRGVYPPWTTYLSWA